MTVFNQSVNIDWDIPEQAGIGVAQVKVPAGKEWKVQSIFCPAIPGHSRVILTYTALDWSYVSLLREIVMRRGPGSTYILSAAIGLEEPPGESLDGITVQLPDIKITEGMAAQLKLLDVEPDPNPLRVDFSIEE